MLRTTPCETVELHGVGFPAYQRARSIVRVLQDRGLSARLQRKGRKRPSDPFTYTIPAPGPMPDEIPADGALVADGAGGSIAYPRRRGPYVGGAATP
jgi:hypothetical protein